MAVRGAIIVWLGVLTLECVALWLGQRRLFGSTARAGGSRLVAYVLVAPGTVLHESAHVLACRALGVPAGRRVAGAGGRRARVSLFWPRRTPGGGVVLGSVPHAATGPLRQALISIAPALLVPIALALATTLLLGPTAVADVPDALDRASWWESAIWIYVALSCGQAAFPSPGDRIGALGGALLAALALAVGAAVTALAGTAALIDVLAAAAALLAVPAIAAALWMAALVLVRVLSGSGRAPRAARRRRWRPG